MEIKQLELEPITGIPLNQKPQRWFGIRHAQMTMLCFMLGIAYGQRVNLSVAIVAMTDKTVNPNEDIPVYDWSNQNVLLSAFFWAYFIPQIGAGQAAERFGPKWFLVVTMLLSSLASIFIPLLAVYGSWTVLVCRIVQGFTQGWLFPCCSFLFGKWAPVPEVSTIVTFVTLGCQVGTAASMSLTGLISGSKYGWPLAFYTSGGLGLLWVLFYVLLGSNSPSEHKHINPQEKYYIESSLGNENDEKSTVTPWKEITLSLPVWAILVSNVCSDWGLYTCLTEVPTYMNYVLNFNIENNGLLSALPYILNAILSIMFGILTDTIINKKWVSVTVGRKLLNTIGFVGPGLALLVLAICGKEGSKTLATTLLVLTGGISAAATSGFMVNYLDLSPVYAGTLMGITNFISNVISIPSPLLVGVFVKERTDASQWSIIFYFTAAVYFVGGLFFACFATGERQPWNEYSKKQVQQKNKETKNVS